MADNVGVTPGSGATMRSRDTGSAQVQNVDVAPMVPTSTGAPINFTLTTAASGKSGGGTFTLPAGTTHVLISVTAQDVTVTEDGATTPTASVGARIPAGSLVELALASSLNFFPVASGAAVCLTPRKYV
jgi:hypothetical protein